MRRLITILLLGVFLFNLFGYNILFSWLEFRDNERLVGKLDRKEYNPDDLVEVRVALHVPYQKNWKEFERYDGEIDVKGKHYRYVMRKVYNDSLVLLCIPHETKSQIQTARDSFLSLAADLQKSNNNKKSTESNNPLLPKFGGDYILQVQQELSFGMLEIATTAGQNERFILQKTNLAAPWQPPDFQV